MSQQNNVNQRALPRDVRDVLQQLPFISALHWSRMGYSWNDAQKMENLHKNIKKCIDGEYHEPHHLLIACRREDFDYVVPHHDIMFPRWKDLTKSLIRRTLIEQVHIKRFSIVGVSLPVSVLDIIFPAIQSMKLDELSLVDVGLSNEGMLRLSSFLRENRTIWNLIIGVNGVDDLSVASSLSDAISNHPKLSSLSAGRCGSNIMSGIVPKILNGCGKLEQVDLNLDSDFVSEGITAISDFIRCNHPVVLIKMHRQKIKDSDISVLATSLKENTNLQMLDLRNCDVTEEGAKALLKSMFDPTSMDSIMECNHKCVPHTFNVTHQQFPNQIIPYDIYRSAIQIQRSLLEIEVLCINGMINENGVDISIQQKIRMKVILALSGVDGSLFDLSHFNDLPLQLMPRALELIQEHTIHRTRAVTVRRLPRQLEKDALSRIFHTLRGWELPLLFENLSPKKETVGKRKRRKTHR